MAIIDLSNLSNRKFFYDYARPGMVGLAGATGPGRLMSTGVRWLAGDTLNLGQPASFWSHVFIVLDRHQTLWGWHITIIESTIVNRFHRTRESRRTPGAFCWNGPQISTLICQNTQGNLVGGEGRKRVRQYIDDEFTPNVALIDLKLQAEALAQCRHNALRLLSDRRSYFKREIVGLLCAALDDKLTVPNPMDMSGLNCTAFVRTCLDDLVPAFRAIDADRRNTFPEHLYRAALNAGCDIYQIVREQTPSGLTGRSVRLILSAMQFAWLLKQRL